ncbi:MAG TPA: DUF2189 domain-containing protein [Rhizomicrobium sp.]|nr:DUF2189 domain-containing protein [Rhizomicrobium sp.]
MTIRNPIEWSGSQLVHAAHAMRYAGNSLHHIQETIHSPEPAIRRITTRDVRAALRQGFSDFQAYRTDVIFLCVVYVALGLVLARLAFGMDMLPLLFPLASGFAILGPFAAIGLYEMSRLREQGVEVKWSNALDVFRAPAVGAISILGLMLMTIFIAWLVAAWAIYHFTLGPAEPVSIGAFVNDVLFTRPGQLLMIVGIGVGFLFALLAMSISIISFPLLLDRDVGLDSAIRTSIHAVKANPVPMAAWGLIVAGGLVLGSLPFFLGLVVVIPVLGHATWHLYRKLVVTP